MKSPVTLYLADDHQIVIDGLKLLISSEDIIKVVGYANDADTALADIIDRKPDLALIDLRMPGPELNGLDLIYKLKKVVQHTKFIILSMHDSQRYIKDAQNAGASGYLLKNVGKEELRKCLNTVLEGGTYFPDLHVVKNNNDKSLFTPREIEIIKLVLDEYTTAQIAVQLSLSPNTIVTHRKNISRKSETNTALGLSKFLLENQIKL